MADKIKKAKTLYFLDLCNGSISEVSSVGVTKFQKLDAYFTYKDAVLDLERAVQEDIREQTCLLQSSTHWLKKDKAILSKIKLMKRDKKFI